MQGFFRVASKLTTSFGGRSWIRTMEVVDNRFTVCPIWPLWKSPLLKIQPLKNGWSWWTDSNPRPADYKSAALPTELHQRISLCVMRDNADDYTYIFSACQHFFVKLKKNFLIYFYPVCLISTMPHFAKANIKWQAQHQHSAINLVNIS